MSGEFVKERITKGDGRGWSGEKWTSENRFNIALIYLYMHSYSSWRRNILHKSMRDEAPYTKSEIMWTGGKNGRKKGPQAERPIGENQNFTGFDVQP